MFDHMEIALHDEYGSKEYWRARRSMRYNSELYDIAKDYRRLFLNSTDKNDNTERPADWTKEVVCYIIYHFVINDNILILISEPARCDRRPIFGGSL